MMTQEPTSSSAQRTARLLTLAGAIPFVVLAGMLFIGESYDVSRRQSYDKSQTALALQLLTTYAAVILSFLGGIQWGIGIGFSESAPRSATTLFYLSVVPSLLAWAMLFVSHPTSRIFVTIFLFGFVWAIDTLLNLQKLIPLWFYKLRSVITAMVIITLLIAVVKIQALPGL